MADGDRRRLTVEVLSTGGIRTPGLASWLADDGRAMSGVSAAARWLVELHGSPVRVGKPEQPWYFFFKLADRFSMAAEVNHQEII